MELVFGEGSGGLPRSPPELVPPLLQTLSMIRAALPSRADGGRGSGRALSLALRQALSRVFGHVARRLARNPPSRDVLRFLQDQPMAIPAAAAQALAETLRAAVQEPVPAPGTLGCIDLFECPDFVGVGETPALPDIPDFEDATDGVLDVRKRLVVPYGRAVQRASPGSLMGILGHLRGALSGRWALADGTWFDDATPASTHASAAVPRPRLRSSASGSSVHGAASSAAG